MISFELADPRVGTVMVTEALVSPDYRRAHVRLALQGTPEEQAQTLQAVEHAKGFLKIQLSERLQLYRTPNLHFEADLPPALAAKASKTLKRMKRGRGKA